MGWRTVIVNTHSKLSYKNNHLIFKDATRTEMIHLSEVDILLLETTDIVLSTMLIKRLVDENILVILPQRGTYVEKIALEQVAESMFLRTTMESEVMKLACCSFPTRNIDQLEACLELQRISLKRKDYPRFFEQDGIFHGSIFAACGKHRIWQMIEQASLNYNRLRMMNLANDGENEMPMLFKHHQNILTAIKQADIEAGRSLINEHVGKVFSNLDDLKLQYPSYFKGGTEDTLI